MGDSRPFARAVHGKRRGKDAVMVSTYATYRTYTQDLTRSLARTAAKPDVLRDQEY